MNELVKLFNRLQVEGLSCDEREAQFKSGAIVHHAYAHQIKSIDRDALEMDAIVSMETEDRDGDRIMVEGWELDNFLKNPVVMWDHNYQFPPIARALSVTKEPPMLRSRMKFWDGDGDWADFAREIFDMYAATPPVMRAFSVGFIAKDWKVRRGDPDEDGYTPFLGFDILRAELVEYSPVPIPAHQDALAAMVGGKHSRKMVSPDAMGFYGNLLKQFAERDARPVPAAPDAQMAELQSAVVKMWAATYRRRFVR